LSIFFNLQEAVTRNTTKLLELRLSFQTAWVLTILLCVLVWIKLPQVWPCISVHSV
jgi:hypothetical protein